MQRHAQGWLWWPLTALFTWSIKVDSVGMLIRHVRRHGIDRAWLLDAGSQLVHYLGWLVIPSLVWGFLPVFAFYLALFAVVSVMLALVFTTGHMGLPILSEHSNGWDVQFQTTRNLELPRWLSFFFVGLDFQIEHHLFPKIPHAHLPRAAVIVRRWAEGLGVPYHSTTYGRAVAEVTRFVDNAWRIDAVRGT